MQFSLSAQYSVSGTVTDSQKKPLIGATVYIKGTYTGSSTNIDGHYKIKAIPEGKVTIVASYLGYQLSEKTITIKKDISNLNFELIVSSVSMEKDVVITANRANEQTPIAFQDLDSSYLSENNIGVDLPYVLQNATSVVTSSDAGNGIGYTSMRIRGSDATRINVTINGIPFNDPESQGTFFVNLPDIASSANDIQIQRGVGTSTNGSGAFGASININTTDLIKEAYGKYTFGMGSFNTLRNSLSFGTGLTENGFAFDGRLSLISSDGYIDRATSDLKSYYAKAGYYGKKFSAKFITFGGNERTYQSWNGVPQEYIDTNRTFNPYDYKDQVDNYSQTHYQLHLNYSFNDQWKASVSGFYIRGKGYYEEYKGTDYNKLLEGSTEDFADYGLNPVIIGGDTITGTNLIRRRWLDNNFGGMVFNLTYSKGSINSVIGGGYNQYSGDHFGEIIWAQYASNSQKDHRYYDNTGDKTDWNIYGKINSQITDEINVFADLQLRQVNYKVTGIDNDQRNLNIDTNLTFFNPKAGISYTFDNQSQSYFSIAIANHEPNRNDYIDAPPGVTPKHETLIDFEGGYRYGNNKLAFNGNLYYMSYTNQLVLTGAVNDVGGAIRQNVNDSYRAGVELEIGYKITSKLSLSLNGTFSENKIKSYTRYTDDWYNGGQIQTELNNTNISFSPNVIAGGTISYKTPISKKDEIEVALISRYVGKQYFDNTQSEERKLDAYFTSDLRLQYTLNHFGIRKLNLNFTARNITNLLYVSNAWAYTFVYPDSGWNPSENNPYVQKNSEPNGYQMVGLFPQAGINFMLGLTLDF
jgi:iron complex outermembrane receptor protein